jgi:hypothetical protein
MTTRRRAIVAACAATIAVVVPTALAPMASQAAAYRYWSYWLGTDAGWEFASVGPAFRLPADGTVEGWRFSVSGVEGNSAPSMAADFETVCAETAAEEGRKRVAVIVDSGASADAPEGEQPPGAWAMCIVADEGATGYDVLRAAASVRTERGLICAIAGYPSRGCADVVADPSPRPTPTSTKSPKPEPAPSTTPTTDPATSATTSSEAAQTSADRSPTPTPAAASSTPTSAASASDPVAPASDSYAAPSPEPTYSLLTAPIEGPPSDGGIGGALVAGIAVVGIAGIGGAAVLRMRRAS